ncbi:hypothetical protein BJV74DRAFT_830243 [Russula compacta]|nr:hypothetical protein BJV74DRAFT_830243 [Russula compacta]
MRIRILSKFEQTNLPHIRSWFNVDREITIASLKISLCASVPSLRDAHVRSIELALTLDDFELLDDSPVHILRDGDLVCLRRRTHISKRRAEISEDAPRKRHKQLPGAKNASTPGRPGGAIISTESPSSSSCSSSGTSSDDTSSNTESSSESSSESDSDSTGSSSSDDLPSHLTRPLPPLELPRRSPQSRPVAVPPGCGKPQTRARNERRRKKRLSEREGNAAPPPAPAGSSNAIPLGTAKSEHTPEPMMMSLKNKNKRRGFKSTSGIPSRITFQDNEIVPSPPPRLVAPSERDKLPPRLFVTSVEVEADVPRDDERAWDRKWKKTQRDSYGQEEDLADVALDYGRPPEEDSTTAVSVPDYTALEKAWVNAPPLVKKDALAIGCVVGWQDLGINPTTLTPDVMLFLARVVSDGESGAVVVKLRRPGSGMVSFACGDLKDEEEEEVFTWDQILDMHWRIVSN